LSSSSGPNPLHPTLFWGLHQLLTSLSFSRRFTLFSRPFLLRLPFWYPSASALFQGPSSGRPVLHKRRGSFSLFPFRPPLPTTPFLHLPRQRDAGCQFICWVGRARPSSPFWLSVCFKKTGKSLTSSCQDLASLDSVGHPKSFIPALGANVLQTFVSVFFLFSSIFPPLLRSPSHISTSLSVSFFILLLRRSTLSTSLGISQ